MLKPITTTPNLEFKMEAMSTQFMLALLLFYSSASPLLTTVGHFRPVF